MGEVKQKQSNPGLFALRTVIFIMGILKSNSLSGAKLLISSLKSLNIYSLMSLNTDFYS